MVFVRYYLNSECIEKYYVIVTEIIATVFEMVFNGYYINSNYIIVLEFLKYTFMKYFEIFPPKILLKYILWHEICFGKIAKILVNIFEKKIF